LVLKVSFFLLIRCFKNKLVDRISYEVKVSLKACLYGGGINDDNDSSGAIDNNEGGNNYV